VQAVPTAVPTPVPPSVLDRLAPGWTVTLAYSQFPRMTTWRLTSPEGRTRFAKVDTGGTYPTLEGEAERLVWAAAYLPVPAVVAVEQVDGATILITEGLPGRDATDPRWRADLPALVSAYGRGLAAFHAAVEEEWCPFRFHLEAALEHVRHRVEAGLVEPARDFHKEFQDLSAEAALSVLEDTAPGTEDLVVCHGDYCPPNAVLTDGRVTGYVDLGELGVADRWWDIAVGGWSVVWNFGPEYERLFYESYGVEAAPERIRFYRLLYDLAS
jgi:kanamycin kinase